MAGRATSPVAGAADTVAAVARAEEPDRYLAALLAPPAARPALITLAAYAGELARVIRLVGEPTAGELRLQWWSEAVLADQGTRSGHPVVDALGTAMQQHALSANTLAGVADARALGLYAEPFADEEALRDYLQRAEGALFALAAQVLHPGADETLQTAARACGSAYGRARLLFGLPRALSRGRVLLPAARLAAAGLTPGDLLTAGREGEVRPLLAEATQQAREALAEARHHVAKLPRDMQAAFLPLALVDPYLRASERARRVSLLVEPRIAPIARISRLAVAHWRGRA
jgi:phytoene synthase